MKTIVITGARGGLGSAIVRAINSSSGVYQVIEIDKDFGDNVSTGELPFTLLGMPINVLINCAGINSNEWFEDLTKEGFDRVMGVNAWGIVATTQALLPGLITAKGTVINIVSNASHIPMTCSLAYNASKAAALMITRQMAHELTPKYGINVLSVSPNKLEGTGMSRQIEQNVMETRGWTEEYAKEYQKKALMHGRETDPNFLAAFIVNLIKSDHVRFLSGCDIPYGK